MSGATAETVPIPVSEVLSAEVETAMPFAVHVVTAKKEGPHAKEKNEDASFVARKGVGALDGIGGHWGGDIASSQGSRALEEGFDAIPDDAPLEQAIAGVREAYENANEAILAIKVPEDHKGEPRPGAAAAAVYFWEGPQGQVVPSLSHIADARIYRLRPGEDGKVTMTQLTLDDSWVNSVVNEPAAVQRKFADVVSEDELEGTIPVASGREEEQSRLFHKRNLIVKSLGEGPSIDPTIRPDTEYQAGDIYFLTSDGNTDNLTDQEMQDCFNAHPGDRAAGLQAIQAMAQARARTSDGEAAHFRAKYDDMVGMTAEYKRGAEEGQVKKELSVADLLTIPGAGEIEQTPDWDAFMEMFGRLASEGKLGTIKLRGQTLLPREWERVIAQVREDPGLLQENDGLEIDPQAREALQHFTNNQSQIDAREEQDRKLLGRARETLNRWIGRK